MNYLQITHDDVCNGNGLRVVLWLSGCSHHCCNCQNPQTWNPNSGIPFDEAAKQEIFDELAKDYISGITLSGGDPLHEQNLDGVLDLIKEIREKYPISPNAISQNALKSSVLEPQNNNEIRISFPEKTIWLYTGYCVTMSTHKYKDDNGNLQTEHLLCTEDQDTILKNLKRSFILSGVDVIVDGEYIDEQRDLSKKWAGSDNQRVIDVQETIKNNKIILYC